MVAEPPYQPTPLPVDADADTVWIFEQGWPSDTLLDNPHLYISRYPVFSR